MRVMIYDGGSLDAAQKATEEANNDCHRILDKKTADPCESAGKNRF